MNGVTDPVVPNWVYDLAVLCMILVPMLVLWIWSLFEARAARRRQAEQRIEQSTDAMLGAGLRSAWRRGWIKDGDQ